MSPPPSESDAAHGDDMELVRASLAGVPGASEALGWRFLMIPRILRAINRRYGARLGNADIEDLAQDAFLVAWNKLEQFQGPGKLDPWVYRICQLRFLNHRRNAGRRNYRMADDGQEALASIPKPDAHEPDKRADSIEERLLALDEDTQEIIRLKHFEGMSFEAIAQDRDLGESGVKSRYYRGLNRLRRSMGVAPHKAAKSNWEENR